MVRCEAGLSIGTLEAPQGFDDFDGAEFGAEEALHGEKPQMRRRHYPADLDTVLRNERHPTEARLWQGECFCLASMGTQTV